MADPTSTISLATGSALGKDTIEAVIKTSEALVRGGFAAISTSTGKIITSTIFCALRLSLAREEPITPSMKLIIAIAGVSRNRLRNHDGLTTYAIRYPHPIRCTASI